ncbi:MAG: hypothetical protein FJ098_05285 [Deltaproteobacteria bacterium]|nr:hypothetical protein [Deltaproteobacteria bacterium]
MRTPTALLVLLAAGCGGGGPECGPLPDATGMDTLAFDFGRLGDAGEDQAPADRMGGEDLPPPENGFDYPCEPLAVEACVTACLSAGTRKCLKEWGPCIPPEEFCGNCADDDCDGLINEGCPPNPACQPPVEPECPVAKINVAEGSSAYTGDTLHLSAAQSWSPSGEIVQWLWSVQAPAGSGAAFVPGPDVVAPTFTVDAAGQYLFGLEVWDETGEKSCVPAQAVVTVATWPPADAEAGCADGAREGFLDADTYTHIAGCAGAWSLPGITPDTVQPACGLQGGDDGPKPEGGGCSSHDLCAAGWHVCSTWQEVAQKSPTGCAGATPPDAKPKSLFFAIRQPSFNGSVCGEWGDGFNDVFGCGNLGAGLGPDKGCGPLDRVLASTQPDTCGFNEAEPSLGPWECVGGPDSHLNEGLHVTKDGCPGTSCSYDGYPVGSSDKGGVLCCRD